MIVLDTNVVSETIRAEPDEHVVSWISAQAPSSMFITTLTQAEMLYGLELLPDGQRRDDLVAAVRSILAEEFPGRILSFDSPAASAYALIAAGRRALGRPMSTVDAQIAAIARSRGARVATRNIADFGDCGVDLIDPWA